MPSFSLPRIICTSAGIAVGAALLVAPSPAPPATHVAHSGPSDGAGPADGGATTGSSAAVRLQIEGFTFPSLTVAVGATIEGANADPVEHTVTAGDGSFDVTVAARGSARFTAPSVPGTYQFTCALHPGMVGTLVVR